MLDNQYWARDLAMIALLLGLFFGFGLGERALWSPAEGRYAEISLEMATSGDYVTPRLNGFKYLKKPPLFFWLESLSIKLLGVNEWALRLWVALAALLGSAALYGAGRNLFDRRTGLISSVVLGTSSLYYVMGRIVSLDMLVTLFTTCALLSFLLGTREPPGAGRRYGMLAFYIFAALATLTKGLIAIVLPALLIGSWTALVGKRRMIKSLFPVSGLVAYILVAAPWHILASRANPEFLKIFFFQEHLQGYLTMDDGIFSHPWAFIPVLLLGLFPWSPFLFQAIRHDWTSSAGAQRRTVMFLILWAGLFFLFFSFSGSKVVPYILPVFPPLALLLGRYFAAAWDAPTLKGLQLGYWSLLGANFLFLLMGWIAPQHYLERYSNWPSLAPPSLDTTIVAGAAIDYPDLERLTFYLYAQTAVLFLGAGAALVLGKRRGFPWAFSSLALSSMLFLAIVNSSLHILDQRRSVNDLASAVKPLLQPGDEVASYHAYYQDLPVYLGRRVTVVGWRGDQFLGDDVAAPGWIIDDAVFWQRWNGPTTIYMLTTREIYDALRVNSGQEFYLLARTNYNVVATNKRPQVLAERASATTERLKRPR